MNTVLNVVREWLKRSSVRHELAGLSERQLHDVGLNREFVRKEAAKPFWRA